jgi:NAD(P)-dependent dehydrogenase (short-subunit alcohol dehydrogenase family)
MTMGTEEAARPLAGRVAVVTGGGRGLGRAIALELARLGADLVVNDFYVDPETGPAAEAVAREAEALGVRAAASTASVADFAAARSIVDTAVAEFGRLDILVTCAGNFTRSNILEVEQDEWDSVTSVHLTGHVACMRAAADRMIAQGGGGRIVTISSRGGLFGTQVAYSGAKAGIMGLTGGAAKELAAHGITVNCVLPSARTQLFTVGSAARRFGGMPESVEMEPSYVAPLVAFLCTDAAGDVTGRYLYAAGRDVCVYAQPLTMAGATTFLRRSDAWTADELSHYVPGLLDVRKG